MIGAAGCMIGRRKTSLHGIGERRARASEMKKIIEYMKRNLMYAGISEEEYRQISGEIQNNNRQNLMIFSVITCVFLLIMFILSFFSKDVETNRWVYMPTMFITLAVFCIAKGCQEQHSAILLADVYVFTSILFIFGIVLGTVTRPDEQTVTFIALLLTVPQLFTDRPVRMITCIFAYVMIFVITAVYVKVDYVLAADIIDACVFGTISAIISTYMMRVKCQRYLYERKVYTLSETDLLTGLRNRNSFEQNLKMYSSGCKHTLFCVFVDVNGLHEMNNTNGHEAGDKMLQFIGTVLQGQFGEKDTYRIGGDEFVVLIMDETEEVVQRKIEQVEHLAEERSYHVSVGYDSADGPETDVNELMNCAEKRMYEAKKMFYQQKGIDRRSRK